MSAVGVEYIGGPMDGRREYVMADDEDVPPPELYALATLSNPTLPFVNGGRIEAIQTRRTVYERHPSPRPYGPPWLYILKGLDL